MRALLHSISLATALLTAGCALQPMAEPTPTPAAWSGRMAVRIAAQGPQPARALTTLFELRGDGSTGELDLSSPLGTLLGRARWGASDVILETPQGQRRYADMDTLTRDVLGETVPVAALFDWLRGQPWTGADSRPTLPPEPAGFEQLGWTVNLERLQNGHIIARRSQPPTVTVHTQLDRP